MTNDVAVINMATILFSLSDVWWKISKKFKGLLIHSPGKATTWPTGCKPAAKHGAVGPTYWKTLICPSTKGTLLERWLSTKGPSDKLQPKPLVILGLEWPLASHPTADPDWTKAFSDDSQENLQAKFSYLLGSNKRITTGRGHNPSVFLFCSPSLAPISSHVPNPRLFAKSTHNMSYSS